MDASFFTQVKLVSVVGDDWPGADAERWAQVTGLPSAARTLTCTLSSVISIISARRLPASVSSESTMDAAAPGRVKSLSAGVALGLLAVVGVVPGHGTQPASVTASTQPMIAALRGRLVTRRG